MDPLYIVGGEQKDNLKEHHEWHMHRAGSVLRLDPDTRSVEKVIEYQSPPDVCPEKDPSFLFKSSTLSRSSLYTCTSTEVLVYDFPSMSLRQQISHPCFNDLHHVNVDDHGAMYVANTGLDQVVKLAASGDVEHIWSVLDDGNPWSRFSPEIDYRKVATTKPHAAHPNYTFLLDGDVWATRCKQRDAVCLTTPGRRFQVGATDAVIHDGVVRDSGIYFTQVDAHLIRVNRESLEVEETIDLSEMMSGLRKPGWTRGLHVVDDERVIVGFTRMRPTKWSNNLSWVKLNELRYLYRLPARVCLFNLRERRMEWEVPLQKFGMTTVFSVHPESDAAEGRIAA
jgi:hypothetical protein